jgi:tripartite-type tricarboxylate transporter receptor subunit TctC
MDHIRTESGPAPARRRALAAAPGAARAQAYPSRTLRIVVPHAAGGNSDAFGRILAQRLAERIGPPVVVENRTGAGAGGTIACASVARAPARPPTATRSSLPTPARTRSRHGSTAHGCSTTSSGTSRR